MAEAPAAAPALSVVVPVYNGAATVGELVQALRGARDRGRARDRAGGRRQPGQQPRRLQAARRPAGRAGHGAEPQPQFRRAQRGHGGPRPRARRLCHHHGRRPAEPAGRGHAPVRACARRQLRRGLHLLCREAARGLAQSGQPLHQLVRRPADRQAARPLSLELPLHFRLRARAHRGELRGSVSLCRRAGVPGHAECRPPAGPSPAAQRGAVELHAAPADAAVALDVPQFLGDAAAARHPVRPGLRRAGRARRGHRRRSRRSSPTSRRKAGRR